MHVAKKQHDPNQLPGPTAARRLRVLGTSEAEALEIPTGTAPKHHPTHVDALHRNPACLAIPTSLPPKRSAAEQRPEPLASRLGRPKPPPNRSPKRAAGTPDESLSNSDFVPGSCAEAPRLRRSRAEAPLRPRPRPCVRNHDDTQLAATVSQGPRPAATDRHANRSRRASGAADRQRRPQKLSRLGEARIRGRSIESPRHRSARAPSRSSEPHAPIAAAKAAETAPTLLPYRESFECALLPPTEMGVDSAHREPNATEAAVGLPLPRRRSARASRARPHTKMRDRDDASETRRLGPTDPRVDQLPRSRTTKVARSRGEPA